jgi:hypothetical protein
MSLMQNQTQTQMALPNDHPMMVAWNAFCSTDEFKNALRWAVETKYDDGREVGDHWREQHAKGAMWLAFTKGIEFRHAELAGVRTR